MKKFINKLKDLTSANLKQKKYELWDVEGVLHNQKFKFDLRPLKNNIKTKNNDYKTSFGISQRDATAVSNFDNVNINSFAY